MHFISACNLSQEFYEVYKKELKECYEFMLENTELVTIKKGVIIEEEVIRQWKE